MRANKRKFCKKNFPGVDLIDNKKRIVFQVTSTSEEKKVKNTLEKIIANNLQNHYDNFYILILSDKRKKYSEVIIKNLTGNKINFPLNHIIYINDLFNKIQSLDYARIKKIEDYLELQLSDNTKINNINTILPELAKKSELFG